MVKQTQTIRWLLPTNCVGVFEHFMGLAIQGLIILEHGNISVAYSKTIQWYTK